MSASSNSNNVSPEPPRDPRAAFNRQKSVAMDSLYQLPQLDESLHDFRTCLELFLDNRYVEALSSINPWERKSLYHTFAKSILCFINCLVSRDLTDYEVTEDAVADTLRICLASRRKTSILDLLHNVLARGHVNYEVYTDSEVHSELITAQARLINAILEFLRSSDLSKYDKVATTDIRCCTQSFKICLDILAVRAHWSSEQSKADFKSGTHLGVGLLNVLLSALPSKVKDILADNGCLGDYQLGLHYLELAADLDMNSNGDNGVQRPLAVLATVAFNLALDTVYDIEEADSQTTQKLLNELASKYKTSAFVSYLRGMNLFRKGSLTSAAQLFKESANNQHEWLQLKAASYNQLMNINAIQQDYEKALFYCTKLQQLTNSALNDYQMAILMLEKAKLDGTSLSPDELARVTEAMTSVVAASNDLEDSNGMTVSLSHAIKNARRFLDGHDLLVPVLELLYLSDCLAVMSFAKEKLVQFLEQTDECLTAIVDKQGLEAELDEIVGPPLDDYLTLKLLKGMCFRYLARSKQAVDHFKEIIERKHRLSVGSPLAAIATVELGSCLISAGEFLEARFWLKAAREEDIHQMPRDYQLRIEKGLEKSAHVTEALNGIAGDKDMFKRRRSTSGGPLRRMSLKPQRKRSNSIGFQHTEMN